MQFKRGDRVRFTGPDAWMQGEGRITNIDGVHVSFFNEKINREQTGHQSEFRRLSAPKKAATSDLTNRLMAHTKAALERALLKKEETRVRELYAALSTLRADRIAELERELARLKLERRRK